MFRFPWGDMHSLNLGWFLQKFNELREDWATAEAGIDGALDAEIEKAEDALSDVFAARDAAAASATAAAGSASSAGTSATAAQNSATSAASSATLANQKATAAGLSEAAAAQSATAAGNSATSAAGSATTASTAATNAAASQTAAGQSATAAAASATSAATSETNAAASAAAAEAVEESIPEDYSAMNSSFRGNTGEFTSTLLPNSNEDLFVLNNVTPTTQNERTVYARGNTFGTKTRGGKVGTTYFTFALSKNLKFIGNSDSNVLNTLTIDDFTPILIPDNKILRVHISFKGKNTEAEQTRVAGAFRIYTMNPTTLEIANVGFQGFAVASAAEGLYTFYDFDVIATDPLPQLYENQNILIAYQTRSACVEEEFTVNIGLFMQNSTLDKYKSVYNLFGYVEARLVATKPYSINDCFVCGNNLYRVTAPIENGETMIPGTNVTLTSVTELLTQLLN